MISSVSSSRTARLTVERSSPAGAGAMLPQAWRALAERVFDSGSGRDAAILSLAFFAARRNSISPVRSTMASASTIASVSSMENISGGRLKPGRRIYPTPRSPAMGTRMV